MKRDSYSDQQAHASFQPRSPQSATDPTQLGQPVHHSSSTSDGGANWLNKASSWVADKFQTAQTFVNSINDSGDVIAPDQILPALRGTANRSLSQSAQSDQPLVGVIDSGFGADEHGSKMVEAIQKENPQAKIWRGGGVGTGGGLEALVEFVDVAKATGQSRAVANLSFDLTEVHSDGSISTRTQLTAKEQSALAYARDNGVLVVASAGNQGGAMSALGQASQPFDNLIAVGAANGSDRASYSSYGKGLDLVADVGTAGTSLAAAKTTGAIAKLWSNNPELSSQQVNQMLTATATDLKTPGWDAETGAGLLNSAGAVGLAKTITPKTQIFSGAQLMQQVNKSSEDSTWRSTNGSVASEQTAGFAPNIALVKPNIDAIREAVDPPSPQINLDVVTAEINRDAGQLAFERHREMERDLSLQISDTKPDPTNALDLAMAEMEQSNPTPGQVAIQQGDTLWDVAQEKLGSGDRWRELRKPDGSPFTEQEASQLQVGTSVQIPGTQPDPTNPLDVVEAELADPTPGQVAIQQGDTLWDVAQEKLGSGDRWRELRKPDGSPFTEQEASQLQVGTSVQIPGTQPDPPLINGGISGADIGALLQSPPPVEQPNLTPAPEPNPPAPPPPAPAPNHFTDFFGSVVNKVWEAGEGAVETVTNPGQAANDFVNSVHTIVTDPGQAWDSFSKPYLDALNDGRYGDFLGQIGGDALLAVSPGGLAVRVNNVLSNLPDAPPATIPSSPNPTLPEPTPVRTPSPSPTLSEPPPPPAPNAPALPPPGPAPNLIASIPDDFGNALREMGDGETLDNPPPSVPPTPQSGSPGNGDNILPQNPLPDGGGSPSPSGSELADPNVSRPPAADLDRQLVTVGARDLEQTSSSPDRSTADSRNYEPVAFGGDNGGTRPSDPPTAVPTPSATTRSDRADSPPEPQSGSSGGGNQPPQEPPTGGGGSRPTGGYDDSNNNGSPGGSGGDSGNSGSSPNSPSSSQFGSGAPASSNHTGGSPASRDPYEADDVQEAGFKIDVEVGSGEQKSIPVTRSPYVSDDALANGRYFTYTFRDKYGAVKYTGRTSKKTKSGGAKATFKGRMGSKGKHDTLEAHSDEIAEIRIEGYQDSKLANAGAEDVLYTRYQIPGAKVPLPDKKGSDGRMHEIKKTVVTVEDEFGKTSEISGGINEGGKQLWNKDNPVSDDSASIRNPFFYPKARRKKGKDQIRGFDRIRAFAEELRKSSGNS